MLCAHRHRSRGHRPRIPRPNAAAAPSIRRSKGVHVEALDLARWQFGITTVYHFLQVPLTIGMAFLVAIMQTKVYKGGPNAAAWDKVAQFFGKLLLINFALGAATGIVQEFQFGMNWSEYARYMGDIFGAPLAFEALLSFFLESTFVGIWVFGRGRISPKAHLRISILRGAQSFLISNVVFFQSDSPIFADMRDYSEAEEYICSRK